MAKSVGAYRDPWQDGKQPVTEGQFRRSLPLLLLPRCRCEGRTFAVDGPADRRVPPRRRVVADHRRGVPRTVVGPLADGLIDDRVVVCSGTAMSVRSYQVSEADGAIRITSGDG